MGFPVRKTPVTIQEVLEKLDDSNKYANISCPKNSSEEKISELILDASNSIHRESLRGPGNVIVVNESLAKRISTFKDFIKASKKDVEEVNFENVNQIGFLANRFFVLSSKDMPEDKILIGRFGEGFEYNTRETSIPHDLGGDIHIDVVVATDPRFFKGELSYYRFINVT